jgi:tryptophan halogenase
MRMNWKKSSSRASGPAWPTRRQSSGTPNSWSTRSRFDQAEIDEYNRLMSTEIETVRDFVILHYKQTKRDDTPFWRQVRDMEVPESLARRMAVFANLGRLFVDPSELFGTPNWVAVMLGQGLYPRGYEPLADSIPEGRSAQQASTHASPHTSGGRRLADSCRISGPRALSQRC